MNTPAVTEKDLAWARAHGFLKPSDPPPPKPAHAPHGKAALYHTRRRTLDDPEDTGDDHAQVQAMFRKFSR